MCIYIYIYMHESCARFTRQGWDFGGGSARAGHPGFEGRTRTSPPCLRGPNLSPREGGSPNLLTRGILTVLLQEAVADAPEVRDEIEKSNRAQCLAARRNYEKSGLRSAKGGFRSLSNRSKPKLVPNKKLGPAWALKIEAASIPRYRTMSKSNRPNRDLRTTKS